MNNNPGNMDIINKYLKTQEKYTSIGGYEIDTLVDKLDTRIESIDKRVSVFISYVSIFEKRNLKIKRMDKYTVICRSKSTKTKQGFHCLFFVYSMWQYLLYALCWHSCIEDVTCDLLVRAWVRVPG